MRTKLRFQDVFFVAAICIMVAGCAGMRENKPIPGALLLADQGVSSFQIVVADDASPSTKYASEELQHWLKEMTGATLPVVSDKEPVGAHEIVLGANTHLEKLNIQIDFKELGREGYVIKTAGPHLVIAGGALRGNMYGVYGLLEDHLGCRWFTPAVNRIPKVNHLAVNPIDEKQIPLLEYREPFVIDCFDGDWCARNRMNSSTGRLEEKHGGKVRFGAGMFVHTFNRLVPPDKYFDEHPEYFSEINGKRIEDRTQLCCTNDDVIQLCIEAVKEAIKSDPDAFVFSVSQNDWDSHCECAKCQALAKAENSQMAPVLQLVNRVAEAIEPEFPDKAIETLAYQWTRKPPKTMRPRPNVIIRLCSIECCFMHPLATCDCTANQAFRKDAEGWAKVADRLWVWDYVTSFRHYMCPFPNQSVLKPNIQFFIKNNVRGIFEQDNYQSLNGDMSPLGGYIMAKLLWNADYDVNVAMNEFLENVYGKAAKPIRQYIDMLNDRVAKENIHAVIWVGPTDAEYLDDAILAQADRLWDKAERAVASEPEILERVKIARLATDYAIIERARAGGARMYEVNHQTFTAKVDKDFQARVQRFFEVARRANVTRMDEGRVTLDMYEGFFKEILTAATKTFTPLEPIDPGNIAKGIQYAYYEGQFQKLPDFASLEPDATGVAETINTKVRKRKENFALRFTGLVRAPRNGVYTFFTRSNDGSRLLIGDQIVVNNDGLHGLEEASGVIALKAGLHPITVEYFQEGGTQALITGYEGPNIKKQNLGPGTLFQTKRTK